MLTSSYHSVVSFWQQGPYYPNPIICTILLWTLDLRGLIQFGKDRCSLRYTESSVFYHNGCINKVLLSARPHTFLAPLYKPKACHQMVWNIFITGAILCWLTVWTTGPCWWAGPGGSRGGARRGRAGPRARPRSQRRGWGCGTRGGAGGAAKTWNVQYGWLSDADLISDYWGLNFPC